MFRKLMLLGAAIAALMAVGAPAAQAEEPVVTNESGEPAWHVTADGVDVTQITPIGVLACTTVTLTVTFDENTEGTARGSGTGDATGSPLARPSTHSGHCVTEPSGTQFAFTSVTLSDIHLEKNGGSAEFGYKVDITHPAFGHIPCGVTGTADLFYVTGDDTITLSDATYVPVENAHICAITGVPGAISGSFDLIDENGGTVALD